MRSKEKYVFLLHLGDDRLDVVVVALMGRIDVVPDWRFHVLARCKLTLLIHVSSTDELDAKVIAESLRCFDLTRNDFSHALHVALVAIHDDGLAAAVVAVGHLLAK